MATPKIDTRIKSARFARSQEKALLAMNGAVLSAEPTSTNGSQLPTSDPTIAGALWSNAGVVTVSAG